MSDKIDTRSYNAGWECGARTATASANVEIERLQEHKRKQAEDIMILGQMVGKLEARNAELEWMLDWCDKMEPGIKRRATLAKAEEQ